MFGNVIDMMSYVMNISPVAVTILSWQVRWYSLAYLAAIVFAYYRGATLALQQLNLDKKKWNDVLELMFISGLVGGRVGHCLFYDAIFWWSHPWEVLYLWHGGMSFFGAMIGAIGGLFICKYHYGCSLLSLSDIACTFVPVGLGLGRLANLVNSECIGRVTQKAWGIVFPLIDQAPRYPTQLVEALFEGLLLYGLMRMMTPRKTGVRTGVFLIAYGMIRLGIEPFKEVESVGGIFFYNPSMVLAGLSMSIGIIVLLYLQKNCHAK